MFLRKWNATQQTLNENIDFVVDGSDLGRFTQFQTDGCVFVKISENLFVAVESDIREFFCLGK